MLIAGVNCNQCWLQVCSRESEDEAVLSCERLLDVWRDALGDVQLRPGTMGWPKRHPGMSFIHSFIRTEHLYSASSRELLRGARGVIVIQAVFTVSPPLFNINLKRAYGPDPSHSNEFIRLGLSSLLSFLLGV